MSDTLTRIEQSYLVEVTNTGLVLAFVPTRDEYQQIAEVLGNGWRSVDEQRSKLQWAIGDLYIAGEKLFGEEAVGAIQASGIADQTVRNLQSVCRSFPRQRRRALSFSHHDAVRALPTDEQDRLLDLAEQQAWSRTRLREERKMLTAANGTEVAPVQDECCECCGRTL